MRFDKIIKGNKEGNIICHHKVRPVFAAVIIVSGKIIQNRVKIKTKSVNIYFFTIIPPKNIDSSRRKINICSGAQDLRRKSPKYSRDSHQLARLGRRVDFLQIFAPYYIY